MEQNSALAYVRGCFEPADRFLKAGLLLDREPPAIQLSFAFPDTATERLREKFDQIAVTTGYGVVIDPENRLNELTRFFHELIPPGLRLLKNPSFFSERKALTAKVEDPAEAEAIRAVCGTFRQETGFDLEVEVIACQPLLPKNGKPLFNDHGQMEINTAFAVIDREFMQFPGDLIKRGKKTSSTGEFIELSFVTPVVGERHRDFIAELGTKIGWEIRWSSAVNQAALFRLVDELLKFHGKISGNPSIHLGQKRVEVKMSPLPDRAILAPVLDRFRQTTGFQIVVKG